MNEILKAILFGVVEGLTEFLPISSTGHLILLDKAIKLSGSPHFVATFEVVIQLGAILSVVMLYFSELWPFGKKQKASQVWKTWGLVLIATIPAFVLGFLLDDWIEAHLFTPWVVSLALVGYGILLLIIEWWGEKHFEHRIPLELLSPWQALGIGVFQCLALVPGTSRSLATILGGLFLGLSRESAARFSFFLAIPVMIGASGLKLFKHASGFSLHEIGVLGTGFVVSFGMAWLAIKGLMRYIQRHNFKIFGYYRIILGGIVLILLWKGGM
ncbi:MAG: undecaprenyl-diphosphate phosphatase [Brevinematales bacterium]|nr:undecaprenyl-diphosphate phosphatase [Brevinematales bacterium]